MEPLQDWRSPLFEEELGRLDRGGVSFEFLRRNRKYQQDYADTMIHMEAAGTVRAEAVRRLADRWGLSFPCRPRCLRRNRSSDLESQTVSCGAHRYCRIRGLHGFFAS